MGKIRLNNIKHYTGTQAELPATLPYGDTYFSTDEQRYFVYNENEEPREITSGSIDEVEELIKTNIQGYIGLLSGVYFGDAYGTAQTIAIEDVDVWQDVVMTIQAPVLGQHAGGISDERVADMKTANTQGYEGTGAFGDPIKFLLEGMVVQSAATLRTSLTFVPDEDGGRLDSRIFLERHSGASPSEDFPINAAGLAMESGADEFYPHLVNVQFFVGDTINTNGPGDAGKIRFQIKSDVTGTIYMNEMALFIQL
tara:strand:+ start:196 stop:957 length:762 start_codon:yes stop_codon:yes gene_type:complete